MKTQLYKKLQFRALSLLLLLGLAIGQVQAQDFAWAKGMGSTGNDRGNSVAVDAAGNIYTTGYFVGTVDFDPGPSIFNLNSSGSNDIFVSKFDASGNFVWAKNMGGTSSDIGLGIAVDAAGNIYTTGNFRGIADFNPGSGTFNLTSTGNSDIFVSKLDASGNFIWAKNMGGTNYDVGWGISVDSAGNIYTTGEFRGIADFDPGAGTFNHTSSGIQDIFISKLDASGNFLWAKNMGGVNRDIPVSIAVDVVGNTYTIGYFEGTADFDPGAGTYNLTPVGSLDIFISKLDASGNFVWAKKIGGTSNDVGLSIAVDAAGNIYSTGYFEGTSDFDPGTGTFNLTSTGNVDIFISKLDASGNFVWAKKMGGTNFDAGWSISVDAAGSIYTTGEFRGIADFDPGAGTFNHTSFGIQDIFISKLDASGNFVWAKKMGGTSSDVGLSIAVDAAGNIYSTGYFEGTSDFDPGTGTFNLISTGGNDIFISKLSQTSEINLQSNGNDITGDGTNVPNISNGTDFGNPCSAVTHSFTIQNIGTGELNLTGNPLLVAISGSSDFTISTQPTSSIIAGLGNLTFEITYTPTIAGLQTATVSIANDDADESIYTFNLSGIKDVPDAPTIDGITAGVIALSIDFTPPVNTGTSAISNYEYSIDDGANWITPDPVQATSPLLIEGLTFGTTYAIKLRAVNAQGVSCESNMLEVITLVPQPADAPNALSASPGVGSAHISFTEPASNGGFPIINYEYRLDQGSWTAFSPEVVSGAVTIEGLSNCSTYSVELRAVTAFGPGTASDPVLVIPVDGQREGITWTARPVPEANNWYSVTYGNGLFVAVSINGTNRVMTSPDGITWTARPVPEANNWYSVTYGNGLFVAVANYGTNNRVMTSPDGITWTARSVPEANNWSSVTYGNGLFVAVAYNGTNNRVMTSSDGITWTARSVPEANYWHSVTYGNGLFVAVAYNGTNNRVMTSSDGITWTARSVPEANYWFSVTYGNGLFVAVAGSGTNRVMTSMDGITWTARPVPEATNYWWSVTYGNGLFVSVAPFDSSKRVMTSSDGITWTARSVPESNAWRSVTYGNGLFVAVSANGTNRVMTSSALLVPDSPGIDGVTAGLTSLSVDFTPPVSPGGSAISNYEYSIDNGANWITPDPVQATSPLLIEGLTFGTAYAIKLRAVNAQGISCESNMLEGTTLSPIELHITADPNQSKVYGEADPVLTFTATGFQDGDTEAIITGALVREAGETVGLYAINQGDLDAGLKYTITYTPANFEITALDITGSFTADNKIYDGDNSAALLTRTLNDVIETDEVSLEGGTATFGNKDVGTGKTVTLTGAGLVGADAGNYTLASVGTTTADILTLEITGSLTAEDKTYDGGTSAVVLSRTANGIISPDEVSLEGGTATFGNKDVGTGKTVTLTGAILGGADAGNYTLTSVGTTTADITALEITGSLTAEDKTYDGGISAVVLSRTANGIISPDEVSLEGGTATFGNKDVGTGKTVTLTGAILGGADAGNYTLTSVGTTTADILALEITGSLTAEDKTYDGGISAVVLSRTANGIISPDEVSLEGGTATFGTKDVGTGKTVTLTGAGLVGADAANYTLTSVGTTTADILALEITGSLTAEDKTYDGGISAVVLIRTANGIISPDEVSLEGGTATFGNKDVGTGKTVTLTGAGLVGADAGNYTLTSVGTTTADILALEITGSLTAEDKTYDGGISAVVLSRTANGIISPDEVSLEGGTATFGNKDVGTGKTVTLTGASLVGADAGNYTLTSVGTTTADILALEITGSLTAEDKTYDGGISAVVLNRTANGIISPDEVSLEGGTATFTTKDVGTGKTVTLTGASLSGADAGNYTLTSVGTTTADILALEITGSLTAEDKTYDGGISAVVLSRTANGIISPDEVSLEGGTATFTTKDVGTGKTVTLTGASLSGADAGNYTLTSLGTTTADILALEITGSLTAEDKTYDGGISAVVLSRTANGIISPDEVSLEGGTATFGNKDVGTGKTVTLTGAILGGADAGNYTLASVGTTTADILALEITGSLTAEDKTYDGGISAVVLSRTANGIISPDEVSLEGGTATFGNKDVGTGKTVTLTGAILGGADAGNYTLTSVGTTTADILALEITGSLTAEDKTYDGGISAVVLSRTANGIISPDEVSLEGGTATFGTKDVGTSKTVTLTGAGLVGADAGNYTLTSVGTTTADITIRQVDVTAQTDTKNYDGDNLSAVSPVGGILQTGDSWISEGTQTFDDKNVGTGKTLTAMGASINDGNGGQNYNINYVPDGTGEITIRQVNVTAQTDTKNYDGNNLSSVSPVGGILQTGDSWISEGTQKFDNINVGTFKVMTAIGASIEDGNGGQNYNINYVPDATGEITIRQVDVTAQTDTKNYDGDNLSSVSPVGGILQTGDSWISEGTQTFDNRNVGTSKVMTAIGASIEDGNGGQNYNINYVPDATGEITIRQVDVTAQTDTKNYDGDNLSSVSPVGGILQTGDSWISEGTQTFDNRNVGTSKVVTAIGASIEDGNGGQNYNINYVPDGTGEITIRQVDVTAQTATKNYDGDNLSAVLPVGGTLQTGDNWISEGTQTFDDENAGTGKILTPKDASINDGNGGLNYSINYVTNNTGVINQIAATITVSRASGDYNGSPFKATGDVTGLGGVPLSPIVTFEYEQYDGNNWSGIAGAPTDAGAYRVRSNFAGNLNYTSGSSDWTAFTIDKVNASVTPNASSKYCGQEDPDDLSGTLVGFISGDNVTATYSINGDVISATLSPAGVLGNYNITYNTAVFSIFGVVIDVSESGTPVPLGSTATLTASIVPAVSGVSVQFLLDNVPYNTVLTNNGIATLDVSGLDLGVYKITAIVGNDCSESIAYLPIYDPDGNFVTGGGWIMSPVGAYKADEDLTGKASFGFVSKYKKGSSQVDGNTSFQFKAGDLKFKSTWHELGTLVISGRKATYRGEGTINEVPGFKFTLVALDGDWNDGSGPDQFRIKIWGGTGIIYDNGLGADDNSDASTVLGGGSIAIHKAKGKVNKRVFVDLVEVPWNTPTDEIERKITNMSADWFEGKDIKLNVNADAYNGLQSGFYAFKIDLDENEWFELEDPITVNVLVENKPLATDIKLSSSIMLRNIENGSKIGDLRTIDPLDDQHTYTLAEQSDFEIVGQSLIWKGDVIPAKAIITVFSTDRAGQTIERSIELTREPRFGEFRMFPNPAHAEVNLEVDLDQNTNVWIRIFDGVGRLVYQEEGVQNGNLIYQINIDDLSAGYYVVQVVTAKLVMEKILIKK